MNTKQSLAKYACKGLMIVWLTLLWTLSAQAQAFLSGSTGADGAFNPTVSQTISPPASGVFNFTTVNIPAGVTISFPRSVRSKPIIILASGDVTIAGAFNITGEKGKANGSFGMGGSGGFIGGPGAPGGCKQIDPQNSNRCIACECKDMMCGYPGDGPGRGMGGNMGATVGATGSAGGGGGHITDGQTSAVNNGAAGAAGGAAYDSDLMTPLIGGSGGGGGSGRCEDRLSGGGGGGGGGAILIASSTKIILNGSLGGDFDFPALIDASGGGAENNLHATGGGGAGGSIRLIANEITGSGGFKAKGGAPDIGGFNSGGVGANGIIRLECHRLTVTNLRSDIPLILHSLPRPVSGSQAPAITVTSIAGVTPANPPSGSFVAAADVSLPSTQSNPVTINLATTMIPLGATIKVTVTPSGGDPVIATSSPVTGSFAAGAATVNVNLPAGQSIISVTPITP
ncbi:MAG: hypothetical protein AB7U82_35795 [Blastocatellales bacterium]